MLIVLIFLLIIFLLVSVIFILALSTMKISINNLYKSNYDNEYKNNFCIHIEIYFLNKIKIFKINLNNKKIDNIYEKQKENIDIERIQLYINNKEYIKNIIKNAKISKFKLNLSLDTENVMLTSVIVTIISTFIAVLITKFKNNNNSKFYSYKIQPIYKNKNLYRVEFNCIIDIKIVHIINMIYIIKRKRVGKNGRTSNRRSYDYSYE